jgi:hypothetical protein
MESPLVHARKSLLVCRKDYGCLFLSSEKKRKPYRLSLNSSETMYESACKIKLYESTQSAVKKPSAKTTPNVI